MSHILFIINPAGRGGTGMQVWDKFKSLWPDPIDSTNVLITQRPGQAQEIAAEQSEYTILAVVGGNGTLGEVMFGLMQRQGPKPTIAIIPAGTGNDIARNLGIFSLDDAVAALREQHARQVDLIKIDCQLQGRARHKYAFLMANVGFSANARIKPWMKRYLGAKVAYYLSTILQIIAYRAPQMTVRWQQQEYRGRVWMVIVANVERVGGGGMCIAPGAQFDDGALNISIIPSRSKFTMLTRMLPKAVSGAYVNEPGIVYFPVKKLEVESDPPVILDIDGDIFGTTPATFTICPKALQVITTARQDETGV